MGREKAWIWILNSGIGLLAGKSVVRGPVHVDGVLHGGGAEEVGSRAALCAVRQVLLPLRAVRQPGRLKGAANTRKHE